jgi:hypothetical protein
MRETINKKSLSLAAGLIMASGFMLSACTPSGELAPSLTPTGTALISDLPFNQDCGIFCNMVATASALEATVTPTPTPMATITPPSFYDQIHTAVPQIPATALPLVVEGVKDVSLGLVAAGAVFFVFCVIPVAIICMNHRD